MCNSDFKRMPNIIYNIVNRKLNVKNNCGMDTFAKTKCIYLNYTQTHVEWQPKSKYIQSIK